MPYFLLILIVLFLAYFAFFTPEKRKQRQIKRVQKVFNAEIPPPAQFNRDDPRNETHPDELVTYRPGHIAHRKLAVMLHDTEKTNS